MTEEKKLSWVKASEKLPPNNSDVIWREISSRIAYQHFRNGFFLKRLHEPTTDYSNIEWLLEK